MSPMTRLASRLRGQTTARLFGGSSSAVSPMLTRLTSRLRGQTAARLLGGAAAAGVAALSFGMMSAKAQCEGGAANDGVYVEMRSSIFVVNGFYMAMREKYTKPDASIYYYLVEWDPEKLSWADFREKVLGGTDPKTAADGSTRKEIFSNWKTLGLTSEPNVGDNGMHASASPFEAMAERLNWMGATLESDPFGKAMLEAGIPKETVLEWTKDPQVSFEGKKASLFDLLEDLDNDACLEKAQEIAGVSAPLPKMKMHAFVFIKPHAVTDQVKALAKANLAAAGISAYKEGSLTGPVIEKNLLIDNHYYAIANKASLSKPKDLNPPASKRADFESKFGISWEQALSDGVVYNAVDACERLGVDGAQMDKLWANAKNSDNLVKFGGGFYAGKIPASVLSAKKKRSLITRTSGDMSVFTSGESVMDAVFGPEGGKML